MNILNAFIAALGVAGFIISLGDFLNARFKRTWLLLAFAFSVIIFSAYIILDNNESKNATSQIEITPTTNPKLKIQHFKEGYIDYILVGCIAVLSFLCYRGILYDEKLIKESDRLR